MAADLRRGPRAGRPLRRGRRPDARLGRRPAARILADPDLLESAPLSPLTFAEAEERGARGDGRAATGSSRRPLAYEADALLVRADRRRRSRSCDRLVASSFEVARLRRGPGAGLCRRRRPRRTPSRSGSWPCPAARLTWHDLPAGTRARLGGEARDGGRPRPGVGRRRIPSRCSTSSTAAAGCSTACWPGCRSAYPAALGLAAVPPDRRRRGRRPRRPLRTRGPAARPAPSRPRRSGSGRVPPRDLPGLMRHLAETDALSPPRPSRTTRARSRCRPCTAADGSGAPRRLPARAPTT